MKKTALQELIDKLEESKHNVIASNDFSSSTEIQSVLSTISTIKSYAKALLPKEREYLEEAFVNGMNSSYRLNGKDYANLTFEQ